MAVSTLKRWQICRLLLMLAFAASFSVSVSGCDEDLDTVVVNGEPFTMEFAITDQQISRGMGGRDSFPDGGGMLFIFPEARFRTFYMKDCLIDIDVIFLDNRGIVTAVHEMEKEPLQAEDETEREYEDRLKRYGSRYPARFAIEVEAGTIERLDVKVEDRVTMDLEGLKALAR